MAFQPIYMKDVNLILGDVATGTDYKIELRSVTLTPDSNVTRIKTLDPAGQFSNVDAPEWSLDLGYLGGTYDTADAKTSLQDYLLANAGNKIPFAFAPKAGGAGYQGTVTAVPGPIGGDQGSFSEQSVSLPIDGQPATWAGVGSTGA